MFKKSFIVFLILILILTVLNSSKMKNSYYIETFSLSKESSIPLSTIEEYYSFDLNKKEVARRNIITACLSNAEYDKWKEYIEYIEVKLYRSKVLPKSEESLVVAINLSKDLSLICIMNKVSDDYVFYKTINNLLPINDIKFIKIPNRDYNFLVIYQTLDERLGAYSYEEFFDIYMFKENIFEKLLKENLAVEEIYRKSWVATDAPSDQWEKLIVENNVDFIMNDTLEIFVIGVKNKYAGYNEKNIPTKDMFNLTNSESYSYSYYWNKEFENFSLLKNEIDIFDSSAIVVNNSKHIAQYVDELEKFKILTKSGSTFYLEKKFIPGD